MPKRAIVCVTNDLSTDQRVRKTCLTLQKCGYNVLEIGRLLPDSLEFDPPYDTKRMKLLFNKGAMFYAIYNIRLFFFLLFAKVDLIYSNDLDTLLACYLVSKIRRKELIYDTHEYFTEVPELVHRPKTQRVWERIEEHIFPKLRKVITVCDSIAHIYQKKYSVPITVVRNIAHLSDTKPIEKKQKKTIIYQGALNKGRGLEIAIETMLLLTEYELHIYGKGDIENELKNIVMAKKLTNRILFFGNVPPKTLKKNTPKATIGWCIMEHIGSNYYYALPNKIFDYIHAHVRIIANDFPEIANILQTYRVGTLVSTLDVPAIAKTIRQLSQEDEDGFEFSKASQHLCWEKEEKKLINLICS